MFQEPYAHGVSCELLQGQHKDPYPGVIGHNEAQVSVQVHLGEEMGVCTLLHQPALAFQPPRRIQIDLVELA